jgi:signal transduction histidine kinase
MPDQQSTGSMGIDAGEFLACVFDHNSLLILSCTPRLSSLSGQTPEGAGGRFVIDLFAGESLEVLGAFLRRTDHSSPLTCTLATEDGAGACVAVTVSEPNDRGEQTLICIPSVDEGPRIARLERSVQELNQQNERLKDFTNLLVHDLRNTLHTVISGIDLVQARLADSLEDKTKRQVARISRATASMTSTLGGVMQYLRFEVGAFPLEWTDLNELVDAIVLDASNTTARDLRIHRNNNLPSVVCQRQLIKEVFHNLVGNAIKYSDKEPVEIEIGRGNPRKDLPVIYVRDNGVGIGEADLENIFTPFNRADHRGLNQQGTGVGMALVKKIVESHGGEIWLESRVDEGTTVLFSLSEHPVTGEG